MNNMKESINSTPIKSNSLLLYIFKIATIIHSICLLADLIIHPYLSHENILNKIVSYALLISIITMSIIMSIKIIQFFKSKQRKFISHHKITGILIEFGIVTIVTMILFVNKEITGKFILFIADLSKQTHDNKLIVIVIILSLYLLVELHEALHIHATSINNSAATKSVQKSFILLSLKIFIITGTAIGLIHPNVNLFKSLHVNSFESLILHFTKIDNILYIHVVLIVFIGTWITIGVYYIYKLYKN